MEIPQKEPLAMDNPLLEWLGVQLVAWQPDSCTFALDIEARHLNRSRSLHGGLIATMLDAACGYSGAYSEPGEPKRHAVTVMLNTSYIGRVNQGRIQVTGRVTGSGRKIYFASAELRRDSGELIATAQGSFKRATLATAV
jgi:uncharacterized protein (TIGR00369 family)